MTINVTDVQKRLKSFGYTVTNDDKFAITFIIDKVTNTIRNECNVTDIPDGLYQIAADMVCGEFLKGKAATGQLTDTNISTEAAIKQIKEGDTSITYAVSDGEDGGNSFDYFITFLLTYGKSQFATYRGFVW